MNESVEPVTYTPSWLIQFLGGDNLHWILVCALIALAMILTFILLRGYWKLRTPVVDQVLSPEAEALIKVLAPKMKEVTLMDPERWAERYHELFMESGATRASALVKLLKEAIEKNGEM